MRIIFYLIFLIFSFGQTNAEDLLPIKTVNSELVICSQNLDNFRFTVQRTKTKKYKTKNPIKGGKAQLIALINRMVEARCDLIAVQEVVGENRKQALKLLSKFADQLSQSSHKNFIAYVGESFDLRIRNGFLLNADLIKVEEVSDFSQNNLPKLQPLGPNRNFIRPPLGILISIYPELTVKKTFFLLNFHLKSKVDGWKDPTGTQYEAIRMESAEELRRIVERKLDLLPKGTVVVLLGDRNSDNLSATAKIMSGERTLNNFLNHACSLAKDLQPNCGNTPMNKQEIVGLLERNFKHLVENNNFGSYQFKKKLYLIDEILVLSKDLDIFANKDGSLRVGLVGDFKRGSDHRLVWAKALW